MVTPRFSARGRSVSVASSATSDRSTGSRVKDRWSARLSRSSASVRSIARVLTTWRRSTSSSVSRFGSLRATSSSVCVIASGVRSSWEALAANRCCSATCASSRASMASKAVGELAELVLTALQLDPVGERSVRGHAGGVGDASQRGEHAAGEEPPSERDRTPAGTPARWPRSERRRAGGRAWVAPPRRMAPGDAHRARRGAAPVPDAASSTAPASMRKPA